LQGGSPGKEPFIVLVYAGETPTNEISTSKYTVLTFIPINLFEQFSRVANLYFLLTAVRATTIAQKALVQACVLLAVDGRLWVYHLTICVYALAHVCSAFN
jgi:hypothetical protein